VGVYWPFPPDPPDPVSWTVGGAGRSAVQARTTSPSPARFVVVEGGGGGPGGPERPTTGQIWPRGR
jgi:hypothetical protein